MSLPGSFVIYDEKVTRPFFTMRKLYLTFSKQAVEMLEYADMYTYLSTVRIKNRVPGL